MKDIWSHLKSRQILFFGERHLERRKKSLHTLRFIVDNMYAYLWLNQFINIFSNWKKNICCGRQRLLYSCKELMFFLFSNFLKFFWGWAYRRFTLSIFKNQCTKTLIVSNIPDFTENWQTGSLPKFNCWTFFVFLDHLLENCKTQ